MTRPAAAPGTPASRALGASAMGGLYLGIVALVAALRGSNPETWLGVHIGTFLGFVSLVIEIAMVERSSRTFHAQGVQTTFMSFLMRIVVVGPATLLFMKPELGVDHEAFALSYLATFFVYMCWLTWKTYHAPAHYRPKAARAAGAAAPGSPLAGACVVRENPRRPVGSAQRAVAERSDR